MARNPDIPLSQSELDDILRWLEPTNYEADSSELKRHLLGRAPGTGTWLYETERYRQWRESPSHRGLWVKGPRGPVSRFSRPQSSRISRESKAQKHRFCFFFFRQIIPANRYPTCLVRDWLAQLLPYSVQLQHDMHTLIQGRLSEISSSKLWDCLLRGLGTVRKRSCIADALDEAGHGRAAAFFQRLNQLVSFCAQGVVRFSRPAGRDRTSRATRRRRRPSTLISRKKRVSKEIEAYTNHRLDMRPLCLSQPQTVLSASIAGRSRGLFLREPSYESDSSRLEKRSGARRRCVASIWNRCTTRCLQGSLVSWR